MAIAYDTSTDSAFQNPVTSASWSHVCTGSNIFLMVMIQSNAGNGANGVTGVTYNGTALTKLGSSVVQNNGDYLWYWYLPNASSGTHNITVSLAGSGYFQACAASYTGVATTSPIDTSGNVTQAGSSATLNSSLTSSVANDWFIAGYECLLGPPYTENTTSSTATKRITTGLPSAIWDQSCGAAGSQTMTLTTGSTNTYTYLLGALVKAAVTATTFPRSASVSVSNAAFGLTIH